MSECFGEYGWESWEAGLGKRKKRAVRQFQGSFNHPMESRNWDGFAFLLLGARGSGLDIHSKGIMGSGLPWKEVSPWVRHHSSVKETCEGSSRLRLLPAASQQWGEDGLAS